MSKIKIFLALGEGLDNESLELSDLVEHLNLILEPQNIHIYLEKWDYLTSFSITQREGAYAESLDGCEICMVVFGKDFGSFSEKELRSAYERVGKKGINPSKFYVYFKNIGGLTEDLKRFRDSFPEVYTSSPNQFTDINSLKNDFLLKFQLFQNKYLQNSSPIEVKEGKVTIYGKDLFINFHDLPYVNNVTRLNGIKNSIENINLLLSVLSVEEPQYAKSAEERRKLVEEKAKLETTLWETAIKISEFKEHKLSDKLKRAIELFEKGEIERIPEIIDSEELKAEAQTNIDKINEGKREVAEGYRLFAEANQKIEEATEALKNNIREFQLAIQAEELNMNEGWGARVIIHHENIIRYACEVYPNSNVFLNILHEAVNAFLRLGEFDKSYRHSQELLSYSLLLKGENDIYTSLAYDDLGLTLEKKNIFKQAIEYKKKSLCICKKIFGTNHIHTGTSYNNMGCGYITIGKYHNALAYFRKAYLIYKEIKGEDNLSTISILGNLAISLCEIGDFNQAIEYLERIYKIYTKFYYKNHPSIALALNNIGFAFVRKGNYKDSIEYFHKALNMQITTFGVFHPQTITYYNNLGLAYYGADEYEKALIYYKKAFNISIQLFGEHNLDAAISIDNFSEILIQNKRYDEAIKLKLKALDIQLDILGPKNKKNIVSFNNLGIAYKYIGNHKMALECLLKALDLQIELFGENNLDTATCYDNVGRAFKAVGNFQKALTHHLKCLNIFERILEKNDIKIADCYNNIGLLYSELFESDKAIESWIKAYNIKNLKREDSSIFKIYMQLGKEYLSQGNIEKALEFNKKALNFAARYLDNNTVHILSEHVTTLTVMLKR